MRLAADSKISIFTDLEFHCQSLFKLPGIVGLTPGWIVAVSAKRILKNFRPEKLFPAKPVESPTFRDFEFPDAEQPSQPSPYPFFVDSDNPLEALGRKYKPSKRSHNYLPYYWMHFRDIRHRVERVCEIGLQNDASIRMWEEFFPNAQIFGIDIDPKCQAFEGDRRRVFIGDQGDRDFLKRCLDEMAGPLDIVIDDGSHLVEHQLGSFEVLFPQLSRHGIYAIEDTGGVVGDYERFAVNSLQRLAHNVLYWPEGYRPEDWPYLSSFPDSASWADRNVVGVAVYRWICFLFRGDNPGDNGYLLKR
jgi:hypothetical protein